MALPVSSHVCWADANGRRESGATTWARSYLGGQVPAWRVSDLRGWGRAQGEHGLGSAGQIEVAGREDVVRRFEWC